MFFSCLNYFPIFSLHTAHPTLPLSIPNPLFMSLRAYIRSLTNPFTFFPTVPLPIPFLPLSVYSMILFFPKSSIYFCFFKNYFIIVLLQLSAFSLHPSTLPQPNPPLSLASTFPLGFVHVSFIVVPENPSPHCPLPPPLWVLLDCS